MTRVNQNTARIQGLQDQLENALSKIADLENCVRGYNFRIRRVPESLKDTDHIVRSFVKELIPSIPDHLLEMDRTLTELYNPPTKMASRETT